MAELNSRFTTQDLETLIESIGDWEAMGNNEYHVMNVIKNIPMPPEDHEAYSAIADLKSYYARREKTILAGKANREEAAIFLKAKLMLVRREVQAGALYDMAVNVDASAPTGCLREDEIKAPEAEIIQTPAEDWRKKYESVEAFFRDLGVWKHYEKYLADQENPSDSE